jgi:predicted XRE-type DNA-binding protein
MKINTKKVGLILKAISDEDYAYLQLTMQIRDVIKSITTKHEINQKEFCEFFKIRQNKYTDFVKGNYIYSLSDFALINHLYVKLEEESLKDTVPIQVAKSK